MKYLLSLLCILALGATHLSAQSYKIDTGHSATIFSIQHLGLGYTYGRFNVFTGDITFDPANLQKASFSLDIKVASIDTHDKKRDDHLRNADFFDAGTHPSMTFKSSKVVAVEGKKDTYAITGDLSIRGKSKSITVEAKKIGQGIHGMTKTPAIGFHTTLTIDRTEFGVGQGKVSAYVGKNVNLIIALEAVAPKQN